MRRSVRNLLESVTALRPKQEMEKGAHDI
jgi:hypothetical protein